jgi:hypothetical protein
MVTPTASMSQNTRAPRAAAAGAAAAPSAVSRGGGVGGKRRRRARPTRALTRRGEEATASERFQGQDAGRRPTISSPPRIPSMPENSKVFRRNEALAPLSSWRMALSPPTINRV